MVSGQRAEGAAAPSADRTPPAPEKEGWGCLSGLGVMALAGLACGYLLCLEEGYSERDCPWVLWFVGFSGGAPLAGLIWMFCAGGKGPSGDTSPPRPPRRRERNERDIKGSWEGDDWGQGEDGGGE